MTSPSLFRQVLVVVDETTPVRGIRMKIWGKMEIHWKKIEGGTTLDFTELEDYLDEEVTGAGAESSINLTCYGVLVRLHLNEISSLLKQKI